MTADNQLEQFQKKMEFVDRTEEPMAKLALLKAAMKASESIQDAKKRKTAIEKMLDAIASLLPSLQNGAFYESGKGLQSTLVERFNDLEKMTKAQDGAPEETPASTDRDEIDDPQNTAREVKTKESSTTKSEGSADTVKVDAQKSNGSHGVKSGFPIDFALYDETSHYVLYITDDPTEEHKLKMELKNTSGQDITFPFPIDAAANGDTQTKASPTNCHFELRFRKGTLSKKSLDLFSTGKQTILADNSWDILLDGSDSKLDSVYFLCKDPDTFFKDTSKLFESGKSLELTLQQISADAGSGARGTRVEFIPRKMIFKGGKNTLVTGNREQHLFITNHSGQKQIPLHVGFKNSNRVLNDGSKNSPLTLRITNISKDKSIVFSPSTSDSPTFSIEFDDEQDWGLGDKSQIQAITFSADGWETNNDNQIEIKKIYRSTPLSLSPGDSIDITLDNILTSYASGITNLYLYYHHIQGYWDGHFVLTVEKTPLLFMGVEDEYGDAFDEYVGIGTSNPLNKLHVKIPSAPMGFDQAIRIETWGTDYEGYRGGGIIISYDGDIVSGIYGLAEKELSPLGALAFFTRIDKGDNEDFKDEFGVSLTEKMRITSDGNVGIGTTSPSAKLEVAAQLTAAKESDVLVGLKVTPTFDDKDKKNVKHYSLLIANGSDKDNLLWVGATSGSKANIELAGHVQLREYGELNIAFLQARDDSSNRDIGLRLRTQKKDGATGATKPILTEAMTIDGSGNVGIGTAKPSALLQIGAGTEGLFGNYVTLGIVQRATDFATLCLINSNPVTSINNGNPKIQFQAGNQNNYIQMDKTSGDFIIGGLSMLRGTINSNATRKQGTGFTVSKLDNKTGHYLITFDKVFTDEPSASVTQIFNDGDTRDNAVIIALTTGTMKVKTGDANGKAQDRDFSFVLIGPR